MKQQIDRIQIMALPLHRASPRIPLHTLSQTRLPYPHLPPELQYDSLHPLSSPTYLQANQHIHLPFTGERLRPSRPLHSTTLPTPSLPLTHNTTYPTTTDTSLDILHTLNRAEPRLTYQTLPNITPTLRTSYTLPNTPTPPTTTLPNYLLSSLQATFTYLFQANQTTTYHCYHAKQTAYYAILYYLLTHNPTTSSWLAKALTPKDNRQG